MFKFMAAPLKVLGMVGLVLLASCSQQEDSSVEINKHLKQAQYYIDQGQYKAAMIEARNAIQKEPKNLQGLVIAAKVFNATGQFNQAIATLSSVEAELDAEGLFVLGEAYRSRGKFRSAKSLIDQHEQSLKQNSALEFYLLRANVMAGLGEYDYALSDFQEAAKQNNEDWRATLGQAKIYASLSDKQQLEKSLGLLEQKAANEPEFLIFKARLALLAGNLEQAEKLMTDSLAYLPTTDIVTPIRASVISALADILARQKRSSEALTYSRLLAEAFPGAQEAQGQYQEALELYSKGKLDAAEQTLKELLENAPGYEKAGQLLGVINFIQGDFRDADQNFSNSLDPELATEEVKEIFAMNSLRLNKPEDVLKLLEVGIDKTKNAKVLGMYGIAALSAGQESKGLDALKKSAELDPSNARIQLAIANYLNRKQPPELHAARKYIDKAFKLQPQDVYVQRAALSQYKAMGLDDELKQLRQSILKASGDKAQSIALLAEMDLVNGRTKAAIEGYEKASGLAPNNLQITLATAAAYFQNKNYAKSESLFEEIIAKDPKAIKAYQGLLMSISQSKGADIAVDKIKALASKNQSATAYLALTQFYLNTQEFGNAQQALAQAQKLDSEVSGISGLEAAIAYGKGRVQLNNGNFDEARTQALAALKASPEAEVLLAFLAEIELKAQNFSEAEKVIKQIASISPGVSMHLQGDYFATQGNKAEALKAYEQAWGLGANPVLGSKYYKTLMQNGKSSMAESFLKDDWVVAFPNNAQARSILGAQFIARKQYAKAQQEFEAGLQGSPNSPILLNNLAWVLQEQKDKRAESVAERAAALAPNNAAILDTYGWILWQNGKRDKARPIIEKAMGLDPENAEIAKHYQKIKK